MNHLDAEGFLEIIKKTEVDRSLFKTISYIKAEQEKLIFLNKYYKRMRSLFFDKAKSVDCFNKTLKESNINYRVKNYDELDSVFNQILDILEFDDKVLEVKNHDILSQEVEIYDEKKNSYIFLCNYKINELNLNNFYKLDLNYSLSKSSVALVTTINLHVEIDEFDGRRNVATDYISTSDINHYLIASELEDIYLRLKDLNIRYLYFYNALRNNCFLNS